MKSANDPIAQEYESDGEGPRRFVAREPCKSGSCGEGEACRCRIANGQTVYGVPPWVGHDGCECVFEALEGRAA